MKIFLFYIVVFFLSACQSLPVDQRQPAASGARPSENARDVKTAVKSVADTITAQKVLIQYCPMCGRRYSPDVEHCPIDGSALKELQDE